MNSLTKHLSGFSGLSYILLIVGHWFELEFPAFKPPGRFFKMSSNTGPLSFNFNYCMVPTSIDDVRYHFEEQSRPHS